MYMNSSAFPVTEGDIPIELGLTKREYFAGLAMQGEIAASMNGNQPECEQLADYAVRCAEALIKALNAQGGDL